MIKTPKKPSKPVKPVKPPKPYVDYKEAVATTAEAYYNNSPEMFK